MCCLLMLWHSIVCCITDGMSARKFEYGRQKTAVEPKCARIRERAMERKDEVIAGVNRLTTGRGKRKRQRERESVCV